MADEKNVISVAEGTTSAEEKKAKKAELKKAKNKKPNFFVRLFKKLGKLCKDVAGEMKKVVWTPKDELKKSTKLVLVTVLVIGASIAVVDFLFSRGINAIAGLIG